MILLSVAAFAATGDCGVGDANWPADLSAVTSQISWIGWYDFNTHFPGPGNIQIDLNTVTPLLQTGSTHHGNYIDGRAIVYTGYQDDAYSSAGNTYVNIRIRTDGKVIAWQCKAQHDAQFLRFGEYYNMANPGDTVVERAINTIITAKTVSGQGAVALSNYYTASEVGLYDYDRPATTKVRVFGKYYSAVNDQQWFYTVPTGTTVSAGNAFLMTHCFGSYSYNTYITKGGNPEVLAAAQTCSGTNWILITDNAHTYMDLHDASCKVRMYTNYGQNWMASAFVLFE
jgi:hypothetical protein